MFRVTIAATAEPVSLDDVKLSLRIDDSTMDTRLGQMITAAREIVEQQTGWAMATATYSWDPVGDRTDPLPLQPATVSSEAGVFPIVFATNPGVVPEALKTAVILLVGDMLTNTEASVDRPLTENPAFQRLIFPYRRVLP